MASRWKSGLQRHVEMNSPLPQIDAPENALPLSGLQHLAFCPRQLALIHLEQVWAENRLTAEGRLLHERADLPGHTRRHDLRTVRGLALASQRLGLSGRADVVEFRSEPFPVEYKRGRRKPDDCDLVQLCAQALCLEEMLECSVPRGAIFYGEPRRRIEVEFTQELRDRTESLATEMHRLYEARQTPAAQPGAHCQSCSLVDICLPLSTAHASVQQRWSRAQLHLLRLEI
jgi:CRISPR-associated exonuclease Cas4